MLEDAGFDVDPAGAQLLGRDVARICDGTCLRRVEEILRSERLAEALIGQKEVVANPFGDRESRSGALLEQLRRGLRERA